MAFQQAVTNASATPSNDNWKAQGFLNFYLPAKNGGRKKLGAIPLKESKGNEKALLAKKGTSNLWRLALKQLPKRFPV